MKEWGREFMTAAIFQEDGLAVATIYAAEDAVLKVIDGGGTVSFFGSTLDLSRIKVRRYAPSDVPFVRGMLHGLYQAHRGPGVRAASPTLRVSNRSYRRAVYYPGKHQIVMPQAQYFWNDLVLMHELAHALTEGNGRGQRAAHGKNWRKQYASLVSEVIGPEAGLLLLNALDV
jgi:putative metallohydrolase (TIGR04338 family)